MEVERVSGLTVAIPDDVFAATYEAALRIAERKAKRHPYAAEQLIDAATNAILWARDHCDCADTFRGMALAAVERWTFRAIAREAQKLKRRPDSVPLEAVALTAKVTKPVQPLLIEDLPDDLAFVVRLFMVDGMTVREIALLLDKGKTTVARMLHDAAKMLAPGRVVPERRKGEKRMTRQ